MSSNRWAWLRELGWFFIALAVGIAAYRGLDALVGWLAS